jgi:hypothetical protein
MVEGVGGLSGKIPGERNYIKTDCKRYTLQLSKTQMAMAGEMSRALHPNWTISKTWALTLFGSPQVRIQRPYQSSLVTSVANMNSIQKPSSRYGL